MAENENMLAQAGLRFFGKMSASATHEIKNTLAIINESAGLLEDLSLMAQKGQPMSIPRVNDISQTHKMKSMCLKIFDRINKTALIHPVIVFVHFFGHIVITQDN